MRKAVVADSANICASCVNSMLSSSDGLRTHWRLEDFPGHADQRAHALAQVLLQTLAKEEDDATVIVTKDMVP